MLEICPMTRKEANAYVEQHHRHHGPVTGHKGLSDGEKIADVEIVLDQTKPLFDVDDDVADYREDKILWLKRRLEG